MNPETIYCLIAVGVAACFLTCSVHINRLTFERDQARSRARLAEYMYDRLKDHNYYSNL